MTMLSLLLATALQARAADFVADAPSGTGLEWMVLMSVLVPAVVVVLLVYAGSKQTV